MGKKGWGSLGDDGENYSDVRSVETFVFYWLVCLCVFMCFCVCACKSVGMGVSAFVFNVDLCKCLWM